MLKTERRHTREMVATPIPSVAISFKGIYIKELKRVAINALVLDMLFVGQLVVRFGFA
jgi:hypothetical protein